MSDLKTHLKALSEALAVSGDEAEVRTLIREWITPHVDSYTIDALGNLTAVKKGTGDSALKVMIAAHMDETGFMVTSCDAGLCDVKPIGGHDMRFAAAKRVAVSGAKTPGVILHVPIHKTHGEGSPPDPDGITVDLGSGSAKAGDRIAFVGDYAELGETVIRGKAFESRAGCAILLELLAGEPLPVDLIAAFTVQAHVYGRGAKVATQRYRPDAAIILRGSACNDFPAEEDATPDDENAPRLRLGGGVILVGKESWIITSRPLGTHLRQTALTNGIAVQAEAAHTTFSEIQSVANSPTGTPTMAVAIPIRYPQSPNGLIDSRDMDAAVHLLRTALRTLTAESLKE
ncbi:MAG TPA: hypothetical protein PLD47_01590 [Aggregatilineales bacterium]|nr:hypothetical protein [Anaerolineales bacterium]HRE46391.1 hypothetical protein [Aggregatilineales bacterium]